MIRKERIMQIIYEGIDEINRDRENAQNLEKEPNTILFGKTSNLDSLGLVNLVIATEQRIEDETGVAIAIADEKALSQTNSPFRSIMTLADYIEMLLKEHVYE